MKNNVEYKENFNWNSKAQYAKMMASFANREGGYLIFGVKDSPIEREFKLKNFKEALKYVNTIGELAEKEGHHPDIYLSLGKVKVTLFTHKIDGLDKSDFIFAVKVDMLD